MGEDDKSSEVVVFLESAKKLMNNGYYSEAADSIKIALEICPSIENAFGMLIISETLIYSNICYEHEEDCNEFDYYAVLHLHSSSTEAEIKTRFEDLVNELTHISSAHFSQHLHVLLLINHSKSEVCHQSLRPEFDKRRKSTILFEGPISYQKASLREDYLNWKPPIYCDSVRKVHRLLPGLGFMDMGLLSYPRFVREKSLSSPCEEFRYLVKHVFDKMPQRPHYEMLPKVFEGEILEGMKLVLDVAYANLVEEIQKINTPEEFLDKSKGFRKDLKQLSRMGYNVDKLNERINDLQRIYERGEAIRAATVKVEDQCYKLHKSIWKIKDSIEKLNLNRQNLHKESVKVLSEFDSTTQSSLWE